MIKCLFIIFSRNWRRGLLPLWLMMVLVDVGKEGGGEGMFLFWQTDRQLPKGSII